MPDLKGLLRRKERDEPPANPFVGTSTGEYEVHRPRKKFSISLARVLIIVACAVLMLAGVRSILRGNPAPTITSATGPAVDTAAAQQAAASFTADYLTYQPTNPQASTAALTPHLVSTASPTRLSWSGAAWIAADQVVAGPVDVLNDRQVVVSTSTRVTIATPGKEATKQAGTDAPSVAGQPGASGSLPAGYQPIGVRWLTLQTPLVLTDAGWRVDVNGPVFAAQPAGPMPTDSDLDATTASSTQDWGKSLFTAYTSSDPTNLSYLTATGSSIPPISSPFTLQGLTTWSMYAADGDHPRIATAQVGWTLAPTADLSISQTYNLTATTAAGRWFVTSIGAAPTNTTTGGNA